MNAASCFHSYWERLLSTTAPFWKLMVGQRHHPFNCIKQAFSSEVHFTIQGSRGYPSSVLFCFRLLLLWSRTISHHSGVMWRTGDTTRHQLALLCTPLIWRLGVKTTFVGAIFSWFVIRLQKKSSDLAVNLQTRKHLLPNKGKCDSETKKFEMLEKLFFLWRPAFASRSMFPSLVRQLNSCGGNKGN